MATREVEYALRTLGNQRQIADAFEVTPMSVSLWMSGKFPASRVLQLYHLCEGRFDIEDLLASP
jgi:hypothetical protein